METLGQGGSANAYIIDHNSQLAPKFPCTLRVQISKVHRSGEPAVADIVKAGAGVAQND